MKMVSLSDVITSAQPGFASGENTSDGVAQIRMNNIGIDGSLNWNQVRRVPATDRQLQRLALREGDVLFNLTNSPDLVGKSAIFQPIGEPVVFSNHFLRLRTDNKRLDPRYLARWLTSQWQHRVFHGLCTRWVNQASVRKDDLLALQIPLPPLPEQKRIAAILDKADAIRRKRRQALGLADQFLRAVFLEMFGDPVTNPKGWPFKKFSDVCDIRLGKMLDAKKQTGNHGRKYLRNANVQWNRFDLNDLLEMDFDEKDRKTFDLRDGDVLICEGGEVGRSAIWRNQLGECYFQKALH
ncbi:MAG: restriction endonuclease subunit S [Magnetococcales bacterium]|nr:restriction endonuclease subunit S [Magnetococcales bacterium]